MAKEKVAGIYFIQNNITNKTYIGSSADVDRRLRDHFNQLRGERHHNTHLQRSFTKYGEDAFTKGICEIVENVDDLLAREQEWLDAHGDMNIAPKTGSTRGWRASDETRRKMSEAQSGVKNPMFGKKRPEIGEMVRRLKTGVKLTEEHKRKCSEALKGNRGPWDNPESAARVIAAIKLANTGRILSDERKQQISRQMKGRVVSEETKEKHRAASLGRTHTEETKARIAAGKLGKKLALSDEERARRGENGRRARAAMTPEQKSEIARKAYATRRAKLSQP